ncbi:Fc.00g082830.m01.CDS01 [Cosmosporella sp. VM-42]
MSFGYAVGDVIAVLGLFERIAIELRNYKDAPAHFQQLRAELDLVHTTLKHVLHLEPESNADRQTLEQIRAIVVHCSQPLESMVDKMHSREGSLGHFRTTRRLCSIGTRLHWSMVAQSDVDALRKTIMSEMAAINILLGVQQLARVKQLASQCKSIGTYQSLVIEKHANSIAGHATSILNVTSRTQSAIDALTANAAIQSQAHTSQMEALNQNLAAIQTNMDDLAGKTGKVSAIVRRHAKTLFCLMQDIKALFMVFANYSKELLEAISRNTRMLLNISGQLKRILRAIEAIPLHLTLDIVRLDDAHGESWALPLQACRTWDSFCDLLRLVVYANGRPGADIIRHQFDTTLAKTGEKLNDINWNYVVKPGFHVEQAIVVSRVQSLKSCINPECAGTVIDQALPELDGCRRVCGRQQASKTTPKWFGPKLPPMYFDEEIETFRRVKFYQPSDPNQDTRDGFELLQNAEEHHNDDSCNRAIEYLEMAVKSDSSMAENWYLLARAYIKCQRYYKAYKALQSAARREPRSPSIWLTIGRLYFLVNQYRDSQHALDVAIQLNPYLFETWYNLGVLYDHSGSQPEDAADAFNNCLELDPDLIEVRARLWVLEGHLHGSDSDTPVDHVINAMIDAELRTQCEEITEARGGHITINPLRETGFWSSEDYSDENVPQTDSFSREGTEDEE